MISRVKKTIEKYGMIGHGEKIMVALSGGADSTALLLCLIELKDEYGIEICAAHVNHGLRGDEAKRDELFCQKLCIDYNIELFIHKSDVKKQAKQGGESLEMAGRRIRYSFFDTLLKQGRCDIIATAHTINDNAETLLLNLTRGSSTEGMSAIAPKRDNIIRPLIEVSRLDIEKYLLDKNQKYVTDSTNLSDDYQRNRIRHNIIPQLMEMNPLFLEAALRTANNMRCDASYINENADKVLKSSLKNNTFTIPLYKFNKLHKAIASRVIIGALKKIKPDAKIESQHVDLILDMAMEGKTPQRLTLPGNVTSRISYDDLIIEENIPSEKIDYEICVSEFPANIDLPGGYKVSITVGDYESEKVQKNLMTTIVDYGKINDNVVIRPRKEGDKYPPLGFCGNRTVKKMMIDQKIPVQKREQLPLFICNNDIIWCAGLRPSNIFKPLDDTKKFLIITVKE